MVFETGRRCQRSCFEKLADQPSDLFDELRPECVGIPGARDVLDLIAESAHDGSLRSEPSEPKLRPETVVIPRFQRGERWNVQDHVLRLKQSRGQAAGGCQS
jgi:hypothetical protein